MLEILPGGQFQAPKVIIIAERCIEEAAPTPRQAASSLPESSPFLASTSGFPALLAPDSRPLSRQQPSQHHQTLSLWVSALLSGFWAFPKDAILLFGFLPTMVDFENSSIHRFSESRSICKTLKSTFLTPISHILRRLLLWGWGGRVHYDKHSAGI